MTLCSPLEPHGAFKHIIEIARKNKRGNLGEQRRHGAGETIQRRISLHDGTRGVELGSLSLSSLDCLFRLSCSFSEPTKPIVGKETSVSSRIARLERSNAQEQCPREGGNVSNSLQFFSSNRSKLQIDGGSARKQKKQRRLPPPRGGGKVLLSASAEGRHNALCLARVGPVSTAGYDG